MVGGGFNDGKGYIFAKDTNHGIVVFDMWRRGKDRTNGNMVVMGTSGSGKSTAVKHLMLNEYAIGTKIIVIDPESEYKYMCRKLDGNWINTVSRQGRIINPLQVRAVPKDDDEEDVVGYEDEGNGLGALALHLQSIRPFFKLLFPDMTLVQMGILTKCLEELYNKFNIDWETDITQLRNNQFPIMKDLYDLILEKIKILEKKKDNNLYDYQILEGYIRDIAVGVDSAIFNGYTTVEYDNPFTVLDTSALQNVEERIKKAQYYNTLTYCWDIITRDLDEQTILVCDEAYLLIDPQCPQSLIFIRNAAKRCRKYNGSIVVISHSVVDFLDSSVKAYGQAVLDSASYRILMGADGQNLEEMKTLYKLTEAEVDLIYARQRGKALFLAGTSRLNVKFDIPNFEFEYFDPKYGK